MYVYGNPSGWHYNAPCDDECPEYRDYMDTLFNDPMTAYSGCGDEIAADFEKRHMRTCERCQEYGAANIEVLGP